MQDFHCCLVLPLLLTYYLQLQLLWRVAKSVGVQSSIGWAISFMSCFCVDSILVESLILEEEVAVDCEQEWERRHKWFMIDTCWSGVTFQVTRNLVLFGTTRRWLSLKHIQSRTAKINMVWQRKSWFSNCFITSLALFLFLLLFR